MRFMGILLLVVGVIGALMGGMMFGDIGLAAFIGAASAILSGVGFLKFDKELEAITHKREAK